MSKIGTLIRITKEKGLKGGIDLVKVKLAGLKGEDLLYKEFRDKILVPNGELSFDTSFAFVIEGNENSFFTKSLKQQSVNSTGCRIFKTETLKEVLAESDDKVFFFANTGVVLSNVFVEKVLETFEKDEIIELVYTDEDCYIPSKSKYVRPFCKPDVSLEFLNGVQYFGSCFAVKRSLLEKISDCDIELRGNNWYDLILHIVEQYQSVYQKWNDGPVSENDEDISKVFPRCVKHISLPLFSNVVSKDFDGFYRDKVDASKYVYNHLVRLGRPVEKVDYKNGFYYPDYRFKDEPLVSILIPTKDHTEDLDLCMMSVAERSSYKNIEFIVIENNSELDETFEYYERLTGQRYSGDSVLEAKLPTGNTVKVVTWKDGFNYSAINNFGFRYASGDMILLLNNDTEILSKDSIRELVNSCMLPHVGAAGAMLYFADDTIQHGGVVYKIGGFAANVMTDEEDKPEWYYPWKVVPHEMSCCTAACLMMRREAFEAADLLDENLVVALNDVDLCMKIRKAGYNVIFNPNATFHHYESKSRGSENENTEKQKRFEREIKYFQNKWQKELDEGDPYYNVNMTLHKADYSVEYFEDNKGRYKS